MKIRTGFVSNSSSSSFVVYGFKISIPDKEEKRKKFIKKFVDVFHPDANIEKDEFYEDSYNDWFYSSRDCKIIQYVVTDDNEVFVGRVLFEGDPMEMVDDSFLFNRNKEYCEKISEVFENLKSIGLAKDSDSMGVFVGSRLS